MTAKLSPQMSGSAVMITPTKEELQARWTHLELKPATLLHLQEVLDTAGPAAAATVTDLITAEKHPATIKEISKEWGWEELRLMTLEWLRPHMLDFLRLALEALIAWHFLRLSSDALDGAVEMTLALLFLVIGLVAICLSSRHQIGRHAFSSKHLKRRRKQRTAITPQAK
jgi:hypothetical protein